MHHPKYLLGGLGITLATWVEFSRAREVPSSDEFPCWAPVDRLYRRLTDIALHRATDFAHFWASPK